jgi:phosphoribosylaminoimidazole-succinocarboxamide synthase
MADRNDAFQSAFDGAARAHLNLTLAGIDEPAPTYRGKVRDVFARGDELLLVASDRVSAFDVVLGTIPFKGQLLTEQAAFWLEKAAAVCETHFIERSDPQAMRTKRTQPIPVELVVRGFLAGSLMREPKETRGHAYGLTLDPSIADYAPLPAPIITPTTKEAVGVHDQPASLDDLVASGRIASARQRDRIVEMALALFALGSAHAKAQGLLLVDTKYELGLLGDRVILIDEIHTADSSRFWVADSYAARRAAGEPPDMLDKERLRRWLLERGFSGTGTPPALSDEIRLDLASHYADLTQRVTGRPFSPVSGNPTPRLHAVVASFLRG